MPIHDGRERGSEVKLLEIGHSGSRIGTREEEEGLARTTRSQGVVWIACQAVLPSGA